MKNPARIAMCGVLHMSCITTKLGAVEFGNFVFSRTGGEFALRFEVFFHITFALKSILEISELFPIQKEITPEWRYYFC